MRRRILNTMIATLLAVGALLGVPLCVVAWWWVADNTQQMVDAQLRVISDQLIRQEGADGRVSAASLDVDAFAALVPDGGRLTIRYPSDAGPSQIMEIGPRIEGPTMKDSIALGSAGSVLLEIPMDPVRSDQWAAVGVVLIVVVGSVTAGTIAAAVTAGRIADPLIDLADRAAGMARGDFSSAWPTYGIGELDRVSRALGSANAEIALRLERESEIVGDVSHQLRSRLTAIALRLDELSLHPDPAVVNEAEAAHAQVERLSHELDEMVAASRDTDAEPVQLDVREKVSTLVGDFEGAFAAQGRRIVAEIEASPVVFSARAGRLREAISVLVDNALQHGAGTCRIVVDELPTGDLLRISVSDEGPGVADDLVADIFRRGFSAGRGNGVGLSLARALVEADGGRLELASRRPPVFTIVVPTVSDSRSSHSSSSDPTASDPGRSVTRGRVPHR